ncbi:MAG: immunoglobulin domain-containing protein [Verrucomicrobiales bacterium]|nr:immunoglobulin domain-containing protein [Verrucomicrobiales bacterium]
MDPPADLTVLEGQTALFAVGALSKAPVFYQWRFNGEDMPGRGGPRLTLVSVGLSDAGRYDVVLSNSFDLVRSRTAVLTVRPRPAVITRQPQGLDTVVGESVDLSVEATSSAPLSYRWQFNGQDLTGEVSRTLTLQNVQVNQSGAYRVVIANGGDPVVSQPAVLRVHARPANDHFVDRIFRAGASVVLNGNSSYATREPSEPEHAGKEGNASIWWSWLPSVSGLALLDLAGSFSNAVVAVYTNNRLDQLSPVQLVAVGPSGAPRRWQFQAGANTPYQLAVDGSSPGETGPVSVHIAVVPPPVITQQPASQSVGMGDQVRFTVKADSALPLRYQWQFENEDLTGQNSEFLVMRLSAASQLGRYRVRVSSDAGSVTSDQAVLTLTTVIQGQVTDAADGRLLPGVEVVVGGVTNITDSSGRYRITGLPLPELVADFDADRTSGEAPLTVQFLNLSSISALELSARTNGYVTYVSRHVDVSTNTLTNLSFSMTPAPKPGAMRLVLNWGENPQDLDIHLVTAPLPGGRYEVFYPVDQRGSLIMPPFAQLDVDDTDSYGPETITIAQFFDGTYYCFVHKYAGFGDLGGSKAVVNLYDSSGLVRSIPVPTQGSGRYWEVCEIEGTSRDIRIIGRLTDTPPNRPAAPGLMASWAKAPTRSSSEPDGAATSGHPEDLVYIWSFGDGTTSEERNPQKTYVEPGTYTVSLNVTRPGLGSDTERKVDFITVRRDLVPPAIVEQPNDLRLPAAADAVFKVVATGSPPLSYRWRHGSTALPGATNSALLLRGVQTEQEGSYSVVVSNPVGSATSRNASLTVLAANTPPVLQDIPDQFVNEGERMTLQLRATDPDGPDELLRFNLVGIVPEGVGLNSRTGLFSWTPSEAQGPGAYLFRVQLTDSGNPPLSDSTSFSVIVKEVNLPPIMGPSVTYGVDEGSSVSFHVEASDPDLPPQSLTYTLLSSPSGAVRIDSATGVVTWATTEADGPSTNRLMVRVTDDGTPRLSATNEMLVIVREMNLVPTLIPIPDFTISLGDTLRWTCQASDPDLPQQTLTFGLDQAAPAGAGIDPVSGVLIWTPSGIQGRSTNRLTVTVADSGIPPLTAVSSFTVIVTNPPSGPTLTIVQPENDALFLVNKRQTTNVLVARTGRSRGR